MKLGEACDELNAALQRAEDYIRANFKTVAAYVPMEGAEPRANLVFGKGESGEWGLLVQEHDGSEKDLFSTTLERRIQAASAIPALIDLLRIILGGRAKDICLVAKRLHEHLDKEQDGET